MAFQSYYLIDPKLRRENRRKMKLELTDLEIELILKCMAVGYEYIDDTLFVFSNKEKDKSKIFYLQKLIGCKANDYFYNIKNNDFFRVRSEI